MKGIVLGLFLGILLIGMIGFVSAVECYNEGQGEPGASEAGPTNISCCEGLTEISACKSVNPTTGNCDLATGCGSVCTYCGNDICGTGENKCNCPEDCNNTETGCKNLYWIDNTNKECGQKQFCGAYMYLGLQTFESKTLCEKAVNETKNIEKPKNITFVPWQKRNESECPVGCKCVGAVVSCTTADGKTMTIEAGRSGNIITITVDGKEADTNLTLETEADDNNKTKLKAVLSNGRKAEIKIMPDTASETAIAKLGDLGFTIELKEVGSDKDTCKGLSEENCNNRSDCKAFYGSGYCKGDTCTADEVFKSCNKKDNIELVYELTGNKEGKFLGIFKIMASEKVQIDAETGEVKKVIKPWWAFLASGV